MSLWNALKTVTKASKHGGAYDGGFTYKQSKTFSRSLFSQKNSFLEASIFRDRNNIFGGIAKYCEITY